LLSIPLQDTLQLLVAKMVKGFSGLLHPVGKKKEDWFRESYDLRKCDVVSFAAHSVF